MRSILHFTMPFGLAIAIGSCGGGEATGPKASAPVTGSLVLTIGGLPANTPALVTVSGPEGFSSQPKASLTLAALAPGEYTVTSQQVTAGGDRYAAALASQAVSVQAGGSVSVTIIYSLASGQLTVTISGLPAGTSGEVTVTGPGGYSQAVTTTETLTPLDPGTYTVTAAPVTSGPTTYSPSPPTRTVTLAAGSDESAPVSYAPPGGGTLNLSIPALYLVQSVQRPDGSIPLVAGRDAYLRVFPTANQSNSPVPKVRVRLYHGAAVVLDTTFDEGQSGVPTTIQEGSLAASWDLLVSGALIQPGLEVLAEVNPGGQVPESDPADNSWPVNDQPGGLDVRVLPDLGITFIAIHQTDGSTGNITSGNASQFTDDIQRMWPVGTMSTSIVADYSFTGPVLQSDDANGSWGNLLGQIHALRATMPGAAYLYGVVHTNYGSGIAGLGYVPGSPSSTAKTATVSNRWSWCGTLPPAGSSPSPPAARPP